MTVQKQIKSKQKLLDVLNYFKNFHFKMHTLKNSKIKLLKNTNLLSELPIYEELNVFETNKSFRGYTMA